MSDDLNNGHDQRDLADHLFPIWAALLLIGLLLLGHQPQTIPIVKDAPAEAMTTLSVLVAGVVLLVAILVGTKRQRPDYFGWIGLALALAPVTWMGIYFFDSTNSPNWNPRPYLFLFVLTTAWILVTSATLYAHGKRQNSPIGEYRGLQKGMLAFLVQHWQVSVGIGYLYLSTIGFLYEAALYARLGLPATRYVEPPDFALAIVNHPIVAIVVAAVGVVVFVLISWLRTLVRGMARSENTWKEIREGCATGLQRMGVRVLEIPARGARVLGATLSVVALVAAIGLSLVGPLLVANWGYDRIEDQPTGRLTLAQPAQYADGVRHVASTARSMIIVVGSCDPQEVHVSLSELAKSILDAPLKAGEWSAMVIPWTAVASFDTETDASRKADTEKEARSKTDASTDEVASEGECFGGWQLLNPGSLATTLQSEYSEEGRTWSRNPTGGARYVRFRGGRSDWQPRAGVLFAGEPGDDGDWVSLQYSADRRTWDDSLPDGVARYARFRVGGKGEWQPPQGFLLNDPTNPVRTATVYGVSFPLPRYQLTRHPLDQVAVRSELPYLHPGECEVTVVGCASVDGFFVSGPDGRIVLNRPGEDQFDGSNDVPRADDDLYRKLAPEVVDCSGVQECAAELSAVNRILNCGLANLRGLAVSAEIVASTDWRSRLPQIIRDDLEVNASVISVLEQNTPRSTSVESHSNLLVALCAAGDKQVDESIRISRPSPSVGNPASVLFRAASATESGHICWNERSGHNRAAVIRISTGSDGVPGCLTPNQSRWARG